MSFSFLWRLLHLWQVFYRFSHVVISCFWCLIDLCAQFYRFWHVPFSSVWLRLICVKCSTDFDMWHFGGFGGYWICFDSFTASDMWHFVGIGAYSIRVNVIKILDMSPSKPRSWKGSAWYCIVIHNGKFPAQFVFGVWWICLNSSTDSDMWYFPDFGAWSICASRATDSDIWRFPMFNKMFDKSTFCVRPDDDQTHRHS